MTPEFYSGRTPLLLAENVTMVSKWLSISGIEDRAAFWLMICELIKDVMMKYQICMQRVNLEF